MNFRHEPNFGWIFDKVLLCRSLLIHLHVWVFLRGFQTIFRPFIFFITENTFLENKNFNLFSYEVICFKKNSTSSHIYRSIWYPISKTNIHKQNMWGKCQSFAIFRHIGSAILFFQGVTSFAKFVSSKTLIYIFKTFQCFLI